MPPSGDSRPQRVPPIPGSHRTISTRRSPCARPLPRRTLVHPRPHPGTTRDTTPRPRPASPNVRAGPACEPASPSYAEPTTSAKPTKHISTGSSTLIPVSEPRENALQELYQLYEADNPDRANQALGRFADLYATSQTPRIPPSRGHHHRMGRTDPRLPHHTGGYPTDPSKEPTTSTRVLRRVAHGFTNPNNYPARRILVT